MSNNQEMEFADPAWEPRKTQEFTQEEEMPPLQMNDHSTPGSIPSGSTYTVPPVDETATSYSQGYRAQTSYGEEQDTSNQPGSQQQFYSPNRPSSGLNRIPPWVWVIVALTAFSGPMFSHGNFWSFVSLLVAIGVAWLLLTRRVTVNPSGSRQAPETRTFAVGAQPKITITNKSGSINLRSGQANQVSITTIKRGYIFSSRFNRDARIWYNQDGPANTVSARVDGWKLFGHNAVDFEIVVPAQADLDLVTNAGQIHVTNVAGHMKLHSDAGSIDATQVTLQGKSRLKTDVGSITFSGSLDPAGNYELSTDLGNITATVPLDSSLYLSAKTDIGSINTNLPLVQQQRNKLHGPLGPGPHPNLKLRTDIGSININRQ